MTYTEKSEYWELKKKALDRTLWTYLKTENRMNVCILNYYVRYLA